MAFRLAAKTQIPSDPKPENGLFGASARQHVDKDIGGGALGPVAMGSKKFLSLSCFRFTVGFVHIGNRNVRVRRDEPFYL
ncbi:hypothetical protein [Oceanibacterium hippocampi]|uniref:Uncharacterized protein n=1 Tax=Oceanibacterium hippocampi TaxID=745714 RepID=A0A1Y5TUC2_9PROT|nr:hypothetical protein [Oceanibacterium hippocampi]SLN72990.1 hypothetical protein OCH7691_03537 [Oceanibacterium hippocampi]